MTERLLLDTNMLIGLVNETTSSFRERLRAELNAPSWPHFVSVVSIWEMAIKLAIAKLELKIGIAEVAGFIRDNGIEILPITVRHAVAVAHPEPRTKDPFDRLLLGICTTEGMKLVTMDKRLSGHPLAW